MDVDFIVGNAPRDLVRSGNCFKSEADALKTLQEFKAILKKNEN